MPDSTLLPFDAAKIRALGKRFAESQAPSHYTTDDDIEAFFTRHQDAYEGLAVVALSFIAEQPEGATCADCEMLFPFGLQAVAVCAGRFVCRECWSRRNKAPT